MTARSPAQREASRLNGMRGRGPTTAEGRSRSSMNAVGLGIRAHRVLLVGEQQTEYVAEVKRQVAALQPQNEAEDQVVLELADIEFRRRRLVSAEQRALESAIDEELAATDAHQRLRSEELALAVLGALRMTVEQSHPTAADALRDFLPLVLKAVDVARAVESKSDTLISGLQQLTDTMRALSEWTEPSWPVALVSALGAFAEASIADIEGRRVRDVAELEKLRVEIAARVVPRPDANSKRLAWYRRELEREQLHQLQMLDHLRRLPEPASATSGSFVRPFMHVNLRGAAVKA